MSFNLLFCFPVTIGSGWVTKNELLERADFYEEGTVRTRTNQTTFILKAPTYEIQNNKLNDINTLI